MYIYNIILWRNFCGIHAQLIFNPIYNNYFINKFVMKNICAFIIFQLTSILLVHCHKIQPTQWKRQKYFEALFRHSYFILAVHNDGKPPLTKYCKAFILMHNNKRYIERATSQFSLLSTSFCVCIIFLVFLSLT